MRINRVVSLCLALLIPMVLYSNCVPFKGEGSSGQGTTVGNPMVALKVASFTYQIPGSDNLAICLSELTLIPTDTNLGQYKIQFTDSHPISLAPAGTDLGSQPIPLGSYSQVLMTLGNSCGSDPSLKVKNAQGDFAASQSVILTFTGSVSIDSGSLKINFNFQPIANNLAVVAADSEVSTKAAQSAGSLSVTQSWAPLSATGAPLARDQAMTVWTGSKMLVWGGFNNADMGTGGLFDPVSNTWTATSLGAGVPSARYESVYAWTGSQYVVWSGNSSLYNNGAKYNPATDSWTSISVASDPSVRHSAAFVWTGTEILVWGGHGLTNTGGRYNPTTDTWAAMTTTGAPPAAEFDGQQIPAVWTGTEMLVWGGSGASGYVNTGGRYNPSTNSWTSIPTAGAPSNRMHFTPIWTGSELIVWGGDNGTSYADGAKYNPSTNTWTSISTVGAPSARDSYAAIWTGIEMIIFGGNNGTSDLADGGRYNPVTNTWSPLVTVGAPSARIRASAVWTGTQMIIWGGSHQGIFLNDGAIFNP